MFEDLIKEKPKEKPNYDKVGCWCCLFTPSHATYPMHATYPNALYCQRFSEYKKANDGGENCKEYRERIK